MKPEQSGSKPDSIDQNQIFKKPELTKPEILV